MYEFHLRPSRIRNWNGHDNERREYFHAKCVGQESPTNLHASANRTIAVGHGDVCQAVQYLHARQQSAYVVRALRSYFLQRNQSQSYVFFSMDMLARIQRAPIVVLHFDCMRMGQDGGALLKPDANYGQEGFEQPQGGQQQPFPNDFYDEVTEMKL